MGNKVKTVNISKFTRYVHVETDLGIVNIWVNLTNNEGHRTEVVEIIPNNYAGEPIVKTDNDIHSIRLIEG